MENVYINEIESIKELLNKFQSGYAARNIEKAPEFVNELFSKDDDTLIIGTGFGEWCKGFSYAVTPPTDVRIFGE